MEAKGKFAAGGLSAAVLSFLLYQNAERQREHATLVDRIAHLEGRNDFFHGPVTSEEVKIKAEP